MGKKNLSKKDISKVISVSQLIYYFGSVGNALEEAGLERTLLGENFPKKEKLTTDELFDSLFALEKELRHEPGFNENNSRGKYSHQPFNKRFGKWPDVLAHYRKWKLEKEIKIERTPLLLESQNQIIPPPEKKQSIPNRKMPSQFYGEPIDFRGLRHSPINEQGVVYLFGMVSRELGFYIESIQQGFPDCEGKYLHDPKKKLWAKARIEFEYRASNFNDHAHDPNECDFIVCWINDWPDCPITVIELKTELLKLPSR